MAEKFVAGSFPVRIILYGVALLTHHLRATSSRVSQVTFVFFLSFLFICPMVMSYKLSYRGIWEMYKPRGNWMTALRRLERRAGWGKAVLAYEYWIAAPVKRSFAQVAVVAGHDPKLHRKTLYTHGKRLVQKLLHAGFPSREAYQKLIAAPSRKRWGADKMKGLDRGILVRNFLHSLDAEGLDVLLDEIRARGYTITGGRKLTSGDG